jgi:hypothetical protein
MSSWPKDELSKIAETDDLHISPFRDDGVTYGTPTSTPPTDCRFQNYYSAQCFSNICRNHPGNSAHCVLRGIAARGVQSVLIPLGLRVKRRAQAEDLWLYSPPT